MTRSSRPDRPEPNHTRSGRADKPERASRSTRAAGGRSFAKKLDASGARVWIRDSDGVLLYLSPAMTDWLDQFDLDGESGQSLGKTVGSSMSHSVWEALQSDANLLARGYQTRRLVLTNAASDSVTDVCHWMRLGSDGTVLGCLGSFLRDADVPLTDWLGPGGLRQSALVQEQLAQQRASVHRTAEILLVGASSVVSKLRDRLRLCDSLRCHVGVFGSPGNATLELAMRIHDGSARDEPLTIVDGSLMDAELLEAYAGPAIAALNDRENGRATLIIERLDEMPDDAQERLQQWIAVFGDRLRLIGLLNAVRMAQAKVESSMDDDPLASQIAALTQTPAAVTGVADSLMNRMQLMPISIPPLHQRREDIADMATALLLDEHRMNSSARAPGSLADVSRFGSDAMHAMTLYPWPGEMDELADAVRSAYRRTVGERIGRDQLPLVVRSFRPGGKNANDDRQAGSNHSGQPDPNFRIASLDEAIQKYERELINRAMTAANGNKAEAARRLGISRARLLRKLDE